MMRNHKASGRTTLCNGTNFGFWKKRMTYYLMSLGHEVWHFVPNEYRTTSTLPTEQEERKAYIANAKAMNSITSGITNSEFTKIMHVPLPKKSELVNSLKGLAEKVEEITIVQKVLRSLPDRIDSKISAIEEEKDLDTIKMDELYGILTAYEMRKGGPSSKDATFKASKSKKGKERNDCSDKSDVESELAQFVRKLKRGSKLKGRYPLICFKCGKIGHYAAKFPHKNDSDDEGNSKRMAHKKKGFNKKNFFSKQDETDEDNFMVIKKKSDEESDLDESQEALFMALVDDDDSGLEGNVDELLVSTIEENEKLLNKIISLKVENEEIRRREDLLEANVKEKGETCEECEAEIVSLRKKLEQIKKGFKSSQILETILKNQKPQHEKSGIGFKGETSSTKNSAKSYANALSYNPKDESVDEELPVKEIDEHEDDFLIEEEEPKEEEINEEEEEEKRELPHTPSMMKYVKRYHLEEKIIGDRDEGVQTRRRITTSPKRKVIAVLSMIEPETFVEASKDPQWVKAMEEEMSQIEKNKTW
eukprot:PITA_21501